MIKRKKGTQIKGEKRKNVLKKIIVNKMGELEAESVKCEGEQNKQKLY